MDMEKRNTNDETTSFTQTTVVHTPCALRESCAEDVTPGAAGVLLASVESAPTVVWTLTLPPPSSPPSPPTPSSPLPPLLMSASVPWKLGGEVLMSSSVPWTLGGEMSRAAAGTAHGVCG